MSNRPKRGPVTPGAELPSSPVEAAKTILPDQVARDASVDPTRNVILEASAGTGKTSVLVARYLNLLRAGVHPNNILAITFTRQAAAEMRSRIVKQLKQEATHSREGQIRWLELRDRLNEITISTIDAFCLSLLREFPLEAGLEPGFSLVDDAEIPRIVEQATDYAMVVGNRLSSTDSNVAMLLAQLGPWRTHVALVDLIGRRSVVSKALNDFLRGTPKVLDVQEVCCESVAELRRRLDASFYPSTSSDVRSVLDTFCGSGPLENRQFMVVAQDLQGLERLVTEDVSRIRAAFERLRRYFLTLKGKPRRRFTFGHTYTGNRTDTLRKEHFRESAAIISAAVYDVLFRLDRDLNVLLVCGLSRLFAIGVKEYQRELEHRALLDFDDLLNRAILLLRQMDEFSQSRYRLESRYHHVLVDEFQDTSRAQWELVSLLVRSWGEGSGLVHEAPLPPSVFVVGDRKQSIYRFRGADVAVMNDATAAIEQLRDRDGPVPWAARQSISNSFRAVPGLLRFINDLFTSVEKNSTRQDAFRFDQQDQFPVGDLKDQPDRPLLGLSLSGNIADCSESIAKEVSGLLEAGEVRDQYSGRMRPINLNDIAVLFRSRESNRHFAQAFERLGIPTCAYKGLGFFDTDEVKDIRALLRYLANPLSELRAAAFLRSRFMGVSDCALAELAGGLSDALVRVPESEKVAKLNAEDRRILELAHLSVPGWVQLVDRMSPCEVLDHIIAASAYMVELGTGQTIQKRENVKKIRSLVRRAQNRGYATMQRISDHIDDLKGDVSNAVVDAVDAVSLMTVHAAKGLEFPIVFLVDLSRGTGPRSSPINIVFNEAGERPSFSVWPFRAKEVGEERLSELEESKRLLYVALTRARDRLYFSLVTNGSSIKPSRGSLAEVLPGSFLSSIETAIGSDGAGWIGPSGYSHRFAVLPTSSETTL